VNRAQKWAIGLLASVFELAVIGIALDFASFYESRTRCSDITIKEGPSSASGPQYFVAASGATVFSTRSVVEIDKATYDQMSAAWLEWLDQRRTTVTAPFKKTFNCEVKGGLLTMPFARNCLPL
jgi:hypothetical protein